MDLTRISNRLTAPAYKLTIDGVPSGGQLAKRLTSINLVSHSGENSDQLSLTFDVKPSDASQEVSTPKADGNTKLKIWLGYEANLVLQGIFYVDNVSLSGSTAGQTMTVSGIPQNMKHQSNQHWFKTDVKTMVDEIAKRNGLQAVVDPDLGKQKITSRMQQSESDIQFLTRFSKEYNAITKPVADKLIFLTRSKGISASGKLMPTKNIRPEDVIQWGMHLGERQSPYDAVQTQYFDRITGYYEYCYEPSDAKENKKLKHFVIEPSFLNKEQAEQAVKGYFGSMNLNEKTGDKLSLTLIGEPNLSAECTFKLSDLHSSVNGQWVVESATHSLASSGYTTQLEAYRHPEA
jgi:hypothetical protein